MIGARSLRDTSPATAVFVRLTAFVVAAVSLVAIPWSFGAAAAGHASVASAFAISAIAAGLTLATTVAARSVNPLRR